MPCKVAETSTRLVVPLSDFSTSTLRCGLYQA